MDTQRGSDRPPRKLQLRIDKMKRFKVGNSEEPFSLASIIEANTEGGECRISAEEKANMERLAIGEICMIGVCEVERVD
jgi:hypothetical protein